MRVAEFSRLFATENSRSRQHFFTTIFGSLIWVEIGIESPFISKILC